MRRVGLFATLGVLAHAAVLPAQQPTAIRAASDRLGADTIRTLRVEASGAEFAVGQNFAPGDPWPRIAVRSYSFLIDYDAVRMRQDIVRTMGPRMPRGGGVPFTGEQRLIQTISGHDAWDTPIPAGPAAGSFPVAPCSPPEAGGNAPVPAPAPGDLALCLLMLWATPHGFLKAASTHHAQASKVRGGTEVSFSIDSVHRMTGLINARNEVEQVRMWTSQSIVGDMLVETEYANYRDFNGVLFPSHILQKTDGFPSLDLTVASVTANVPDDITVPDSLLNTPPPAVVVEAHQVADGVFWLTGGTHHSAAIEMRDYIVLVDTPNGEARALAVIAKAKELIPGKPVRYVITTHHHWDHLGGIRTAIDAGATIVTQLPNRALLERAAKAPHTIQPDRLAASGRALKLETIGAEGTITDGSRTIRLYTMIGFEHTNDMIMVYLPRERVLVEADAFTPPPTPATPLIASKVPYAAALVANIRRLGLKVQTIVPLHGGRTADLAEVVRQSGRR